MKISISKITREMKLTEDIYSPLGGIVLKKGTLLNNEYIELLEAFGIYHIEIEDTKLAEDEEIKEEPPNSMKKKEVKVDENTFNKRFNEALKVIDHTHRLAVGNGQLPIIELRKSLTSLLEESNHLFKYLTFLHSDIKQDLQYENYHAISVAIISHEIAKWIGLEKGEVMQVALGGLLHDIGKARLPHHLLYKKEKLSNEEFDEIKRHPFYGYQILKNTKGISEGSLFAILQHHEREDGTGYPLRLKKEKIHQYAKIVAIADVFHAMISRRIYREEYSPFHALEEIVTESFGKLNPTIVQVFINNITKSLIGESVTLSNGERGKIIFIDKKYPTKPLVKIDETIINLVNEKDLYIKKIL